MKSEEKKYWIWFSKLRKVSCLKKIKLLEKYQTPKIIWNLNKEELEKNEILTQKNIYDILDKKNKEYLERYEEYMLKNNIKLITIQDELYPINLKKIYDSPVVLYTKGNLDLLKENGIAIVGARDCSAYGKNVALDISFNIAEKNICVISGLAKGIDQYAHIGALKAGGKTIGVIGNGIDNIYPSENIELARKVIENRGLIISEYVIGTRPEKMNFPERNRIISALSNGIVVIEAKEKSGALITADFGLEHGKDIFAVPGNINNKNSEGTNNLIKQGAYLVTNYMDVINVYNSNNYNNYNY